MFPIRTAFLDQVLIPMLNGGQIPGFSPTSNAAGRHERPPQKRKLLFETLEPRILLSADINPGGTVQSEIPQAPPEMETLASRVNDVTLRWASASPESEESVSPAIDLSSQTVAAFASSSILAPAAVSTVQARWIGGSGNWSDAANWDIGIAPNNTDLTQYDVILEVTGDLTITVDKDVTINNLTNKKYLALLDSAFVVGKQINNSGRIQLQSSSSQLTLSGSVINTGVIDGTIGLINLSATRSITATGENSRLVAGSTTNMSNANLIATQGALLDLRGVTAYVSSGGGNLIQSTGPNSRIDLSGLTSFVGPTLWMANTTIQAENNGEIDLAGNIYTGSINIVANSGGHIDASRGDSISNVRINLTSGGTMDINGNISNSSISVSDPGSRLMGAGVTEIGYSTITAAQGASIELHNLNSLYRGSVTADGSGALVIVGGATSLNGINCYARNGGKLDMHEAIDYRADNSYGRILQVEGHGSLIDLSGLASFQGYAGGNITTIVQVTNGGKCALAGDVNGVTTTVSDGGKLDVTGLSALTASNLTVSRALVSFSSTNNLTGEITATNGAIISIQNAENIDAKILANNEGKVDIGGAATIKGYSITATGTGSHISIEGQSRLQSVNLYATDGGVLSLPGITSFTSNTFYGNTILATGLDSRVDLYELQSFTGAFFHSSLVSALNDGEVTLAGTLFGFVNLIADSNGKIDASKATAIDTATIRSSGSSAITLAGALSNSGLIVSDPISTIDVAGVNQLQYCTLTASNGAVWPLDFDAALVLGSGNYLSTSDSDSELINTGTVKLVGNVLTVNASTFIDQGILAPQLGGNLDINSSLLVNGNGAITGAPDGAIAISGDLLGDTVNSDQYAPQAVVRFDGVGSATNPQCLEVMGADFGADAKGMIHNFAYGNLSIGSNTYVRLVDNSNNAAGDSPEALYVNALILPAGSTLDLNGLHLYARGGQLDGTVINGSVSPIPDSGNLAFASPTIGSISDVGQLDEWSFNAQAGQVVTVVVETGSGAVIAPKLGWAKVELLDASGNVVASQQNTYSGQAVTLSGVSLAHGGNYRIRISAPTAHNAVTGYYLASVWGVTPDIYDFQLNRASTGDIENLYCEDQWLFSAQANTQVRFDLINRAGTGISFDLFGPDGWTGFTNLGADSDLITLPSSGTYQLKAHGSNSSVGAYSFRLLQTQITNLALAESFNGEFIGAGQAELFRIVLPDSDTLKLSLDDLASDSTNELYLKYGAAPTRGDYDYRYSANASADQTITVPLAYAGTWYALLYHDTQRANTAYTLTATLSQVSIESITPNHYATDSDITIAVNGAGFVPGVGVNLIADNGTRFAAESVEVNSYTQLTAHFSSNSVPADLAHPYAIEVTKPGAAAALLENAFTVYPTGQANLVANLVVPSSVGYHQTATIWVEYGNTGNAAMPAPLLVLSARQVDQQGAILALGQAVEVRSFWTSAMPEGYANTVQFLASGATPGILQPGESVRIPVQYAGWQQPWNFAYPPIQFTLGVVDADTTTPLDWAEVKDDMRPDSLSTDIWNALWANFTAQAGDTWGEYLQMLTDNAIYLGGIGITENDIGDLLAFEFAQADALNVVSTLGSATDAAVSQPGFDLVFSRVFPETLTGRYRLDDLGYGWSNNWDYQLSVASSGAYAGTVTLTGPGGSTRTFQPDSRPGHPFFSMSGDYGVLTQVSSTCFQLVEADGTLKLFDNGRLSYIQDTNGNRISCTYTDGRLTALTHSSGGTIQIAYNGSGLIESLTDSLGRVTTYAYTGDDLTGVSYYDGSTVSYSYVHGQGAAVEHALTGITNPGGYHDYFSYGANGRLSSVDGDAGSHWADFSYGTAGQVYVSDALGDTSRYYLDENGALAKVVNALGNAVNLEYDSLGNLTRITDPAGRFNQYSYDSHGNVTTWVDANGNSTRFSYTARYNELSKLTDANGNVTQYGYDSRGNLTSITYADGHKETWTYDTVGNPVTWTNGRGETVHLAYDARGKLTGKTYVDGSGISYVYDARGNLTSATDRDGGIQTFTYDAKDQLVRIDYPAGQWLQFTYNAAGQRLTSLDQTGHELTYHYDAVGRLASMDDETDLTIVRYEYDAAGQLVRKTLGNGVYTTYTYDAAGQLLTLTNCQPDGTVLSFFNYTYDSRGRRIAMATNYGDWTYEYDDLGQLTHAVLVSTAPDVPSQDLRYVYDALGNRIYTEENGVRTDYTSNNMNQYTQVGDTTYAFDRDGNLVSETSAESATTYSYDTENRLIAVSRGSENWSYGYDAFGQRVRSNDNGVVTNYVIDPIGLGIVVGEYTETGNLSACRSYGRGLLSQSTADADQWWYVFDAMGNTSYVTNNANDHILQYAYFPFGQLLFEVGVAKNDLTFSGEVGLVTNAYGLISMRDRSYYPHTGVFVSKDPFGAASGDLNLYRFVTNSPTLFADPEGAFKIKYDHQDPTGGQYKWSDNTIHLGKNATKDVIFHELYHMHQWNLRHDLGQKPYDLGFGYDKNGIPRPTPEVLDTVRRLEMEASEYAIWQSLRIRDIAGYKRQLDYYERWKNNPAKTFFEVVGPKPNNVPSTSKTTQAARPVDPNDLIGPGGYSDAGFILAGQTATYRINFENDSTATAPAQQVTITDPLTPNLNWSTFQLTEIGFGDTRIAVPVNSQHFQTTVPFNYNGQDFEVQIEAGIHLATGEVYAYFWSVDPLTGLPPDVLTGFLPPEDGTGRGMGYVSYVIEQQPDLPTGTEIRNIALISFDGQPWIATNQVDPHDASQGTDPAKEALNTIDAGTPTSAVLALPASTTDTSFLVQWSGADDVGGSGIGGYDIYVATDGGAYALWQNDTAETSATFTADSSHSYAFYSRARDNVGHLEAAPASADTVISVLATGTVAGSLFEDLSGDGVMNGGDAALSGWTVYLDANGNNTLDVGEVSATTEADGSYAFTGLVAGDYTLAEVLPAGWMSVTPASGHAGVTLTGGDAAAVDFANFRLGSITGTVFDDDNANQVREAGEAGLSGWTLFLDANGNGSLDAGERSTLSSGGAYRFDDLGPGNNRVTLVDQAGWLPSTPDLVSVNMTSGLAVVADYGVASLLQVTGLDPTESGFHVRFSRAFTPGLLNLYDVGGLGTPDISLKDSLGRVVAGSVVLDGDNRGLTFVKSGGVLASGSYTAQLDSRANAFVDSRGWLLDGNADDVAGGNYTMGFSVTTSGAVLAVGDIVRGPGQAMDVPATGAGFPVTLSNAAGATSIAFDLAYDPALMNVANVVLGSGAPAGSHLDANFVTAGVIHVQLTLGSALGTGKVELIRVVANVPATVPYGAKAVLDLRNIALNGGAMTVRDDDGLHLAAYVGEASGNAKYSTLDLQRLYRVLTRQDAGFSAYPLVDPTVVGDVNGSGTLSTLDMQWLYQKLVGTSRPEIPSIPTGIGTLTFSGADPVLSLPTVTGQPGEIVTVPVNLDDATALESVELTLAYAADKLEVVDVRLAGLTAGFQWFIKDVNEPGIIRIDASVVNALASGTGKLLEIDFRIKPMAHGTSLLDLRWAALNDTHLTLNPEPRPGRDPTDGLV